MKEILKKWRLAIKVLPLVGLAAAAKLLCHILGWEIISMNPLFTGLLAATVFLLGFLVSGVLTDYKESERFPGEMAVSLEAIADEAAVIYRSQKAEAAKNCLLYLRELGAAIHGWFYGRLRTEEILSRVTSLNDHFLALTPLSLPPFIVRLKQEQSALRRIIIRINVIRETSFVSSGYAIAEGLSALLIVLFVLTRIEPLYEALLYVPLITFLFCYLLALIRDLDNPFEYGPGDTGGDEISLKPLEEVQARLAARVGSLLDNP